MKILQFFEEIRTPFFNQFFSFITTFGEEFIFLIVALLFFWCIDKKTGYVILLTGMFGFLINQVLKISFKVDRPWVTYPELNPIKSAIPAASGFSFPSGHTQIATTTYGSIMFRNKNKRILSVLMFFVIILVAVSRMYLGVHYLPDVLFSLVLGLALAYFITKKFDAKSSELLRIISLIFTTVSFVYITALSINEFGLERALSAINHSAKFLGATFGLLLSWYCDEKKIQFSTKGNLLFQILKVSIGLALVLMLKSSLKELFALMGINVLVASFIRYFIMVVFAGVIWPIIFTKIGQLFNKFGAKC